MNLEKEKPVVWNVDGYDLKITNPLKLYWPKEGFTKKDVLNYYKNMSNTILPYFNNRPATIHYYPRGIEDLFSEVLSNSQTIQIEKLLN